MKLNESYTFQPNAKSYLCQQSINTEEKGFTKLCSCFAGINATKLVSSHFSAAASAVRHVYIKLSETAASSCSALSSAVVRTCVKVSETVRMLLFIQRKGHLVARTQKPDCYPERQVVQAHQVSWSFPFRDYLPQYFVAKSVLENDRAVKPNGWADPEDILSAKLIDKIYTSFEGKVNFNERGMPLNPRGRTGIEGRGLLGKWGANFAGDPIVTRINPETGRLEILLILRSDCQEWALPGGMVDDGEVITKTLARELEEEAGIELHFDQAPVVYKGYVDDRRNTDNAWMETTAVHIHLKPEEVSLHAKLVAGDDAKKAKWVKVTPDLKLYATHNDFVKNALLNFGDTEEAAFTDSP